MWLTKAHTSQEAPTSISGSSSLITLIDKIKKDIDNNENEEKSLNKLVLELRPTYN